jgi:hypothetical protein
MADYAKITGNTTGHYDLYDNTATTTDGFAHTAINANASNIGLYQTTLTAADGHQKIFSVVIIKNTSDSVANELSIDGIEVLKNYNNTDNTGTAITGTDAFSLTEYFKNVSSGDVEDKPYIGLQLQTAVDGSYPNTQEWTQTIDPSNAETSAVRAALVTVDNIGHVSIVQGNSSNLGTPVAPIRAIPLHTIDQITSTPIPGGRYAAFVLKCDILDVAEFIEKEYVLKISHNGSDGSISAISRVRLVFQPTNELTFELSINDGVVTTPHVIANEKTVMGKSSNPTDATYGWFDGRLNSYAAGIVDTSTLSTEDWNLAKENEVNDYIDSATFRDFWRSVSNQGFIDSSEYLTSLGTPPTLNFHNFAVNTFSVRDSSTIPDAFDVTPITMSSITPGVLELFGYASATDVNIENLLPESIRGVYNVSQLVPAGGKADIPFQINPNIVNYGTATLNDSDVYDNIADIKSITQVGGINFDYTDLDGTVKSENILVPFVSYPAQSCSPSAVAKQSKVVNKKTLSDTSYYTRAYWSGKMGSTLSMANGNYSPVVTNSSVSDNYPYDGDANGKFSINMRLNTYSDLFESNGMVETPGDTQFMMGQNGMINDGLHTISHLASAQLSDAEGVHSSTTLAYDDVPVSGDDYKDYAIQISTKADVRYRDLLPLEEYYDETSWNNSVEGDKAISGYETQTATVNVAHVAINYGYGIIPDYLWNPGSLTYNVAYLPAPPMLSVASVSTITGTTDFGPNPSNCTNGHNLLNYRGLSNDFVAWNDATNGIHGATPSSLATPNNPHDGLFDWALDGRFLVVQSESKGSIASDGIITFSGAQNNQSNTDNQTACSTAGNATTTVTVSPASPIIQVGMKVQRVSGTAVLDSGKEYYVTAVVKSGVNVTSFTLSQATEAANGNVTLQFIQPWLVPGMRVYGTSIEQSGKTYYLGPQLALANATDLSFQLEYSNNYEETRQNVTSASVATNKSYSFLKPTKYSYISQATFAEEHEIENVLTKSIILGDRFRVTAVSGTASDFTNIGGANTLYSTTGDSYIASQNPASNAGGEVTLIQPVAGPIENGLLKSDNTDQRAPRNNSTYVNLGDAATSHLWQCDLDAQDAGENDYYQKDFSINLYNRGEENTYIKSVEWIENNFLPKGAFPEQQYTKKPLLHTGQNNWSLSETTDDASLTWSTAADEKIELNSGLYADNLYLTDANAGRVSRNPDGATTIYGRVLINKTNAQGVFYKTLKVKHYRRKGSTDKIYDASNGTWNERSNDKREVWISYIQFAFVVGVSPSISITDGDGESINYDDSFTFAPTTV